MAKKKEPINITPPAPTQPLVKSERVKVVVMFNGDNVICDLQEAVDKETGARQAYIMNFPYKVEYDQPKMDKAGIVTDPEVKVCLLYTSPSPRDQRGSRMPSSA